MTDVGALPKHTVAPRIIPRLDIKGPNLVKGIHLEVLRVLGRPEVFALAFYQTVADVLLLMVAVVSPQHRTSQLRSCLLLAAR